MPSHVYAYAGIRFFVTKQPTYNAGCFFLYCQPMHTTWFKSWEPSTWHHATLAFFFGQHLQMNLWRHVPTRGTAECDQETACPAVSVNFLSCQVFPEDIKLLCLHGCLLAWEPLSFPSDLILEHIALRGPSKRIPQLPCVPRRLSRNSGGVWRGIPPGVSIEP